MLWSPLILISEGAQKTSLTDKQDLKDEGSKPALPLPALTSIMPASMVPQAPDLLAQHLPLWHAPCNHPGSHPCAACLSQCGHCLPAAHAHTLAHHQNHHLAEPTGCFMAMPSIWIQENWQSKLNSVAAAMAISGMHPTWQRFIG